MTFNTPVKLRIPEQDLAEFSLFPLNADAALTWAQGLAITNTRQVVQQLRQAIGELNRIDIPPDVRFNIMEELRPNLLIVLSSLSRKFLNQPLVLPEEPRQMFELANTLYSLATSAYTIVAIQAIQQQDNIHGINPARLVCEALQRAIGFAGRKILRTYQIYQPIELHAWLELHQLYALAERQQLANLPVVDALSGGGSITEAYLRALILGCCKPNQLRQGDLAGIFRGMQYWSAHIRIGDQEPNQGLFKVDLGNDQPPIYSALFGNSPSPDLRVIDTSAVVAHLKTLRDEDNRQGKPGIIFDKDTRLASNILGHLINALGTMSKRNFTRSSSNNELSITLGLSNAHYVISGGLTFNQLLYGVQTNEDQQPGSDPVMAPAPGKQDTEQSQSHEGAPELAATVETGSQGRHKTFPVHIANASPGGYCLEWSADLPGDVKTGDIVSIRDGEDNDWVIAVTRWVSQVQSTHSLLGVELLSPKAMPYGARVVHATGEEAEMTRVVLLPEIKLVGQPHTLITPSTGFKESQKVSLLRNGEQFHLQLLRQVASTGSYSQFDFRYIKLLEDVIAEDRSGPLNVAYDSVWTKI